MYKTFSIVKRSAFKSSDFLYFLDFVHFKFFNDPIKENVVADGK